MEGQRLVGALLALIFTALATSSALWSVVAMFGLLLFIEAVVKCELAGRK